MLMKMHTT